MRDDDQHETPSAEVPSTALPRARSPLDPPSRPTAALPEGACDSHVHIFAGGGEFPRRADLAQEPADGSLADWTGRLLRQLATLGLARAVLVHSVAYGEDNRVLRAALERLGPSRFRGVALVRPDIAPGDLAALAREGVRGVRCNLRHGGALDLADVDALASRLADNAMHVQLLMRTASDAGDLRERAARWPMPLVLDHFASPTAQEVTLGRPDAGLLRLLDTGRVYVKLAAAYRIAPPPHTALTPFLSALIAHRPDRMVWGSDWPYVMFRGPDPDAGALVDALADACPDARTRAAILCHTPASLYGF